jgi:AraC-like DNA-binding protein
MLIDEPTQAASSKTTLPLVRLQLLLPFLNELDRLRVDTDAVLALHGIARESMQNSNLFISVNIIHRFLEDAAEAANEPFIGVHVGERLDFSAWSPLADAAARAATLADFLTRFILAASKDASSAKHSLDIKGAHTFFRERRVSEPDITPSQNDAFTAAYVLAILQNAVGEHWDPKTVLLQVCTPEALPAGYHGIQIVGGDNRGISIRFPTAWLTHVISRRGFLSPAMESIKKNLPPGSFLEAFWLILIPRLGSDELTVDHVAQLLGLSRQMLQRRLKASGTSFAHELMQLKQQHAIEALVHTDRPVAEIGETLGFNSPASFTRAFKSWTGLSPREYRKAHERHVS